MSEQHDTLPCPFCGNASLEVDDTEDSDVGGYFVKCQGEGGCGAERWGLTIAKAIAAWNLRSPAATSLPDGVEGRNLWRKKPVVITAKPWFRQRTMPFSGMESKQPSYLDNIVHVYHDLHEPDAQCKHCGDLLAIHGWIDTLEGGHIVCDGDWIITGVQGEHYPCKPEIFAATYEPALTPAPAQPEAAGDVVEAVINAELALLNWEKYRSPSEYDEVAYQADKVADACRALLAHPPQAKLDGMEEAAKVAVKADFECGQYDDGSGAKVTVRYDATPPSDPRSDCRNRIWVETGVGADQWVAFDYTDAGEVSAAIERAAACIPRALAQQERSQ